MPSTVKRSKEARRVTCRCRAHECYLGHHTDPHGRTQSGVEVIRSTLEAHRLADLQLAYSSSDQTSTEALIRPLVQLSLNPATNGPNAPLSTLQTSDDRRDNQDTGEISRETGSVPSTHDNMSPETSNTEDIETRAAGVNEETTSDVCLAANSAFHAGVPVYQCDRFFTFSFEDTNPLLLYVVLIAAMLSIFARMSISTASWLLDNLRISLELCLTHGINPLNNRKPLVQSDAITLQQIPKSITTVFRWLRIDPHLIEMNCCTACFALYPLDGTPTHCNYRVTNIPGGPPDTTDPNTEVSPPSLDYEPDISDFSEKTCGQLLLKYVHGKNKPIRRYAIQSLSDWIAGLLSRPNVEQWLDESLEESQKPFNDEESIHDVHQSKAWKELKGPDGSQYTATSGNLTFAMFTDGINPFGNKISGKHSSITFIVLVCLTLPISQRYLPEHVFVVGIAPGPREPSLEQTNWIQRPIVTELQKLWSSGLLLSRTHQYKKGRLIRAGLLLYIADVVALRRSLGFPSATATFFCSICLLNKCDINNLDPKTWPRRTCEQHTMWALQARDASTVEERKKIFKLHGVRYSALVDLEYWNIVDYHVIDSMHNLLLGLVAWHIRRFWAMKDLKNEEELLVPISKVELLNLLLEHSEPIPTLDKDLVDDAREPEFDINNVQEASSTDATSPSDQDFDPFGETGWSGTWEAPPLDEIVMDATMLMKINQMLPLIHIPTWIKRAIPVLGKASFGKLKADEWRNLCTIQLPLVLIPIWFGKDKVKTSLLKNFCHLVSLVKLALKRVMTTNHINRYEYHIQEYLSGCLVLFSHCNLAPNHHLAIHLSECLRKFGPVRAWWSFPFERLMGDILKGCHNNHPGELEITFLKNYCRAGNLSALLKDERIPKALKPYIPRMQSLYEAEEPTCKELSNSNTLPIENDLLIMLVKLLNDQDKGENQWMIPEKWCVLPEYQKKIVSPVSPRGFFYKRISYNDVSYSSFTANQNDSFVAFRLLQDERIHFGRIFSIFTHRRTDKNQKNTLETWIHINRFPKLPKELRNYDPYENMREPDVQAYLRAWGPTKDHLIKKEQVLGHCSWLMYKVGQLHSKITVPTVGLIYMDR